MATVILKEVLVIGMEWEDLPVYTFFRLREPSGMWSVHLRYKINTKQYVNMNIDMTYDASTLSYGAKCIPIDVEIREV